MGTAIRVAGVSKHFRLHHDKSIKERLLLWNRAAPEEFWALKDVSFDIEEATTLGLIGANGSGKTTLLKLIGGILTPTTGFVERKGRVAALLELGAGFHPDLTGRENVYLNASVLGLTRKQTQEYFDAIVDFSGVEKFIDNQVKFYSSGMYVRLAFAVAVHVDPQILLIDEVLAVGDEPFQRKCLERIKQFQAEGRTIVFVTHGLETVRELCDRVIMLDGGELVADGKPTEALRVFRDRYAPELQGVTDERGNRTVEVTSIRILGSDGKEQTRLEPGDDLIVEVVTNAHQSVDDPVVGVAIHNHMDSLVFGTNTALKGTALGRVEGERTVRFRFHALPMIEGRYFLTVAVHSKDGSIDYHWLERHVSFTVSSATGEPGILHMRTTVEVE